MNLKELAKKNGKKRVIIKTLTSTTNFEIELSNFLDFMAITISKRFKNQVLAQLSNKTVEKFSDAQIGNYAVIFGKFSRFFENSIQKQFSSKRIQKYIKGLYIRLNRANSEKFYKNVDSALGVSMKDILKNDGLNTFLNAKSYETAMQIEALKDIQISNLTTNTLRLMSKGANLKELYKEVENITAKNLNKSEIVKRNELKTFNAQLSKKRAQNLDIKERVWNAIGGDRTRPCHKIRDGKKYSVNGKLYSACDNKELEAGEEINCRCYDTFVIEV